MSEAQRLDKWLWFARVVKTRTLAAALVTDGKVRVNRLRVEKPSHAVKPGDVLTVIAHARVRILRVKASGARRGPPSEAAELFEELTPETVHPLQAGGGARPTKRDRRLLERLVRGGDEES
jgi:ribosome-associated heat shock protein Hsp15